MSDGFLPNLSVSLIRVGWFRPGYRNHKATAGRSFHIVSIGSGVLERVWGSGRTRSGKARIDAAWTDSTRRKRGQALTDTNW